MRLSEQIYKAAVGAGPRDCEGLVVKLLDLRHENYPGRDANGVLPVVVVGHAGMTPMEWATWVKENAVGAYGTAVTERMVKTGVDLKEMLSEAPFGRAIRLSKMDPMVTVNRGYLDYAGAIVTMVEKWPSLYNLIATELAEKPLTLREFVDRIHGMPAPWEIGRGRMHTLGDLIGRVMVRTPDY